MLITGVVHTKNEEGNLARALRSLATVCDTTLVADMGSTDSTTTIARSFGATVLAVPDFGYADPAWALALAEVTTPWVLRIDADEAVPPQLARRLREIAESDSADVVDIGRMNFMFGAALRGTGWEPQADRHFFFFKPALLQSVQPEATRVHTIMRPLDTARVLRLPARDELVVWHFNYLDWSHFISKMDRYTSIEARDAANATPLTAQGLSVELIKQIARRGVLSRFWRDGYRGGGLLWLMMTYRILVYLKRRQLTEVGDAAHISRKYHSIAEQMMNSSQPADEAIS